MTISNGCRSLADLLQVLQPCDVQFLNLSGRMNDHIHENLRCDAELLEKHIQSIGNFSRQTGYLRSRVFSLGPNQRRLFLSEVQSQ